MNRAVKVLVFGSVNEFHSAVQVLDDWAIASKHTCELSQVEDLEEFEIILTDWEPSVLVVLADGAKGMECVYRTKETRPNLPVFWFSDDEGFGIQSYRLNCAYFSTKPVTLDKIHHAIHRCNHCGIAYCTG